jgi:hypothetical protein
VFYFSGNLNKRVTIELKTTVLKFSPIDLVIGRESVSKYNLFSEIPIQLAAPPTACSVDSFANSTCCKATSTPCGCQLKRRSLLQDGSPKDRFTSQQSDLATSQPRGVLGALADKSDSLLNRAAADVDQIDPASSDTFCRGRPNFSRLTHSPKFTVSEMKISESKSLFCARSFEIYSATNSMIYQHTYLRST